jgi:hypothetical protein
MVTLQRLRGTLLGVSSLAHELPGLTNEEVAVGQGQDR